MRERRFPWVVTSVLLLASGVAAAWSTYLHWSPCRGALLSYSVLMGYQHGPGPGFSDECLRWMDAGSLPFPSPSDAWEHTQGSAKWAVAAMVLAGSAWLVLVLGMRWSVRTKVVALLPGVGFNGLSGVMDRSLYTVLNLRLPPSEENKGMVLFNLDLQGIQASGGSACSSGSLIGSHVLASIKHPQDRDSVRFSFSRFNSIEEVDTAIEALKSLYSVNA